MLVRLLSLAVRCGVCAFTLSSANRVVCNRKRGAALLGKGGAGKIIIVTTAAIPWRTGTAVNPALRAAQLAADTEHEVVLVVPFVPVEDQRLIFPEGVTCSTPQQQEAIIKAWAREHSGLQETDFTVLFYAARYFPASRCIFATEDVCRLLPKEQVSLVLLEEPEHLNWYRAGSRWSNQFSHVVGVLHTHYSGYAADLPGGPINKAAVGLVCRVVCRLHCHKGAYFLGKALWDKGHGDMMALLQDHEAKHGQVPVDVYGSGPDLAAIEAEAARRGLALSFKGQADHCCPALQEYKVFINCCKKDVLATATAEAVAMNKWALLPHAPCNAFFAQFPNVLLFSNAAGFSAALCRALEEEPPALSAQHLRELSWAAATERLLAAASIQAQEWPGAAAQLWDDCLWVPYRLFALLFIGARNAFAPAPKLQQQQQQCGAQEPLLQVQQLMV
ncbi:hypothetical protein OEZ86_013731 [Tetradesmus obliquus]|nr:hypothetical protein OEZ86_013731 [Tetradesmus obliquus]